MPRAFVLCAVLFAVTASAQFTAEKPVSIPQYGPAAGDQFGPMVATNGSEFLVAWVDWRGNPAAIYANRVRSDGRLLDGSGIRIPLDLPVQNAVMVGVHYIDSAYTLVYSYLGTPFVTTRTCVAVISADGRLIDGPRVILDEWANGSASNGSRIVLSVFHGVVALDAHGNILDRYSTDLIPFALASNGTTFLAGAVSEKDTAYTGELMALDANGQPGDVSQVSASSTLNLPRIASDGRDFLAVYDGLTLRVDAHAQIQSTLNTETYQALAWTGASYVAVAFTSDQRNVELVNVDRNGAPLAAPRIAGIGTPGLFNQPAAAWNGSEALFTWMSGSHDAQYGFEIAGAMVDASGALTSSVMTIPSAANAQRNIAVATSGAQDLVAWAEPDGIYAARLTAGGTSLDGGGIKIASAVASSTDYLADAGFATVRAVDDGSDFIVAWGSNGSFGAQGPIIGQRVSHSGALVGDAIEFSTCSRTFDLVMGPDAPVLFHTPCSGEGLVAQKIPGGAPVLISNLSGADFPRAAWNGNEWLVVWNNVINSGLLISPPVFYGDVYAARLSAALSALDPQPIPISVSVADARGPLVATDGRDFVLVWSVFTNSMPSAIYTRAIHADGSADTAAVLVADSAEAKSIVWTGQRYVVGYATWSLSGIGDLFLTRVGANDQLPISTTSTDERDAVLVAPPGRPMRVVYTRVAPEPEYGGVLRAFVRDELLPKRRSIGRR